MATANPFGLLVDDDNEDPIQLLAASRQQKVEEPKKATPPGNGAQAAAKLPSKPLPPAQAVRESRSEGARGSGRGRGYGYGRGRGGGHVTDRESNRENLFSNTNDFSGGFRHSEGDSGRLSERRGGFRGGFRGGRRSDFRNGEGREGYEHPHRAFVRRSGTGHGNEQKRDGAGCGNWGTSADEIAPEAVETVNEVEKVFDLEKPVVEEDSVDAGKDGVAGEVKEQEPEDKEMTLEEYEKVLEEKRKVLLALKTEERKVDRKVFESMQQLSNKKDNVDIFIKLGSEKDKRKDVDKEDKSKKSVSINEFLKPAEGDRNYTPGGRGRGRGRGPRPGGYNGSHGGRSYNNPMTPSIGDLEQFPSLSVKS
ncbi:hypothetical protein SAY87_024390 [Trapa incisa]|uniref:Hyaluronan/mRNA-binding protein domain-containing protein n=1 Tax=Trapa incisa TaxID=236973 RepID=A0AAN7GPU0_9MYRT|nr:hypothetical protein SAY87_024390 [Trapa incisa]